MAYTNKPGNTVLSIMDALLFVKQKPRSVNELHELVGVNKDSLRIWLNAACDVGLVCKREVHVGVHRKLAHVYEWVQEAAHDDHGLPKNQDPP